MATKIFVKGGRSAGEYKGKTVESIARRVFGRKAVFIPSQDRNSPESGVIGYPANGGGFNVLGTVLKIKSTQPTEGEK